MKDILRVFAEEEGCTGVKTALFGGGCWDKGIEGVLELILTILTGGVVIAAIIGIVLSGVQYMSSGGDTAMITKAKKRLSNVVIGLVAYGLLYAFLEWLIPGGLF